MTLHEFYAQVERVKEQTGQRYGQALFNHLYAIRPVLANEIRGTDLDPFYVADQGRLKRLYDFLAMKWGL